MTPDALLPEGDGHTALSEEDRAGLIPTYIATRGDLFEAEQRNNADAAVRLRVPTPGTLLDAGYLRRLHAELFGDVWRWAGKYRLTETNIGVEPVRIPELVRGLVDDARYWIEHDTYPADELAARFHHRLVAIHPFPNGNGRFGRVAANYLILGLGRPAFSWGAGRSATTQELRRAYIGALQAADGGGIDALLDFARS